jgi:hypothetical protein
MSPSHAKIRTLATERKSPMKSIVLALIPAFASTAALAQAPAAPAAPAAPQVAPAKCEPKPVYPGLKAMQDENDVAKFRETLRNYQLCMKTYIDERKAIVKAHTEAANAATAEHNAVIEKFRADQDAARKEQDAKK